MEPLDKVIICDKLTKKFGDFTAVNEISFDVKKGEIFGFLGANGAGKTTAIKMLIGLLLPSSGSATVAGFDVNRESENIKKKIGYMSQHFSLYQDMTIKENIRFYGGIYGLKSAEIKKQSAFLIKKLGLEDFKDRYVSELPLGWKQKLAFSIAIIHDPSIVFLDEPTSGLDPNQLVEIRELIKGIGREKTVLLSTHIMQEVEAICNRVMIINKGEIVADQPASQLSSLSQGTEQILLVEFNRPVPAESLKTIPGVSSVKVLSTNELEVRAQSGADIRPEIFRFAVDQGIEVLTLSKRSASMEEVFKELTGKK